MRRALLAVVLLLPFVVVPAALGAQGDTLWVKVTLYDFQGDDANPDFLNFTCTGADLTSGIKADMVQSDLGADGRPAKGSATYCSSNLDKWFKPSGGTGATYNDSTHRWSNLSQYSGRTGEFVGAAFNVTDPLANVVVYDSLPFLEYKFMGYNAGDYAEGTYIYDNQAFFRVDNRGFTATGAETTYGPFAGVGVSAAEGGNSAHNFGFTMELHSEFTYLGGEFFEFVGDDDVWVFVNGKLVMDLGGVHTRQQGEFYLDDLADELGLEKGEIYQMDFFYAERMITKSTIRITTNIITSVPQKLELDYPEQVPAGDTADIIATLLDQFGMERKDLVKDVEWEIVDDTVAGDKLLFDKGEQTGFVGEKAHRSVTIQATYWIDEARGQKLVATAEIEVIPGAVYELRIEDANYHPMPDTIRLDYAKADNVNLYSTAYDKFGNRIGRVPSNWTKDGTLHRIDDSDSTSSIFYDSKNVGADEAGTIVATSVRNKSASDNVYVIILGPKVNLQRAFTRDYDGDGYLDAFELEFSRVIDFEGFDVGENISIWINIDDTPVRFTPKNFRSTDSSKTFVLNVSENRTTLPKIPQTDWLPYISLSGHNDIKDIVNMQCEDGAGPVIWAVTKTVSSTGDRSKDKVTVTFSEPITGDGGEAFDQGTAPERVFNVYLVKDAGDTILIDTMLARIKGFSEVGDSALVFYMTNGNDLTGRHWFSIKTSPRPLLEDLKTNDPNENNQKVRVIVRGDIGPISIGPNPMYPTFLHFEPGNVLNYREPEEAFYWAKYDGGAVMVAEIIMPDPSEDFVVTGVLVVFDAVGNLVYTIRNDNDIIPEKWREPPGWIPGEQKQLVFYWNGITSDNRKAAPGIYRAIVYIDTKTRQQRFVGNVGVGR